MRMAHFCGPPCFIPENHCYSSSVSRANTFILHAEPHETLKQELHFVSCVPKRRETTPDSESSHPSQPVGAQTSFDLPKLQRRMSMHVLQRRST